MNGICSILFHQCRLGEGPNLISGIRKTDSDFQQPEEGRCNTVNMSRSTPNCAKSKHDNAGTKSLPEASEMQSIETSDVGPFTTRHVYQSRVIVAYLSSGGGGGGGRLR